MKRIGSSALLAFITASATWPALSIAQTYEETLDYIAMKFESCGEYDLALGASAVRYGTRDYFSHTMSTSLSESGVQVGTSSASIATRPSNNIGIVITSKRESRSALLHHRVIFVFHPDQITFYADDSFGTGDAKLKFECKGEGYDECIDATIVARTTFFGDDARKEVQERVEKSREMHHTIRPQCREEEGRLVCSRSSIGWGSFWFDLCNQDTRDRVFRALSHLVSTRPTGELF